jgi:type IV fimbrial biogenesis protein FimT
MQRRTTQCGFTLIEAMVSIAVMLVLMAIAVPSFKDASLGSQLRASANDLVASAHLARSEAIKRNTVVTMCMSSDGENCATSGGWEQGWIVRGATTLRQHAAVPSGLTITAGGLTSLSFQPTAVGATAAVFTVCRATPSVGPEERTVTIDATGRPWVRKTANGVCS